VFPHFCSSTAKAVKEIDELEFLSDIIPEQQPKTNTQHSHTVQTTLTQITKTQTVASSELFIQSQQSQQSQSQQSQQSQSQQPESSSQLENNS
jgi:hypothetical protein